MRRRPRTQRAGFSGVTCLRPKSVWLRGRYLASSQEFLVFEPRVSWFRAKSFDWNPERSCQRLPGLWSVAPRALGSTRRARADVANKNTVVVINDTVYISGWQRPWTRGPTVAWDQCLVYKKIINSYTKQYCLGRGMSWGNLNVKF
jgi:hypothetical protein